MRKDRDQRFFASLRMTEGGRAQRLRIRSNLHGCAGYRLLLRRALAREIEQVLLNLGAVLFGILLTLRLLDHGTLAGRQRREGNLRISDGPRADLGNFTTGRRIGLRRIGTRLARLAGQLAKLAWLTRLTGLSRL